MSKTNNKINREVKSEKKSKSFKFQFSIKTKITDRTADEIMRLSYPLYSGSMPYKAKGNIKRKNCRLLHKIKNT